MKRAELFYRFDDESTLAKRALVTFLFHTGQYGKAIEIGEQAKEKDERQRSAFLSLLAASYWKTNQTGKADQALSQLELLAQSDSEALYSLAMNYAELGRTADALSALQKCFDLREERLAWLNVEPRFANLRSNVRVHELAHKMHLD